MLENRKVLTALIGYILGILMGLYCKISIVPFYICIYLICLTLNLQKRKSKFKLFSFKRYFRYVKTLFNKKVIIIIIFFSIISNTIVLIQNNKYDNLYKSLNGQNCNFQGIIENVGKDKIRVKIVSQKYKNTYMYIYTKGSNKLKYGDKIEIKGEFSIPEKRSNYKGFDKFEYYKTLKIYGTINCKNITLISENNGNLIKKYIYNLSDEIKQKIKKLKIGEEKKALIEGILLGNKENLSEETKENFSESNISYILAVSGMHVTYIILLSNMIFNKIIGKHYSKLISSFIIILYMFIVNFTPSVVRSRCYWNNINYE